MAISPPSDIVLDVARAADPDAVGSARAALANRTSPAFVSDASFTVSGTVAGMTTGPAATDKTANSMKKFEAMVLQTFIQNMLPKNAEDVYGKGMAGDMWKSLMAQQMADALADRGGIGIADKLLKDRYVDGDKTLPLGPVSTSSERVELDQQADLSTAMVQELQRRMARAMTGEPDTASTIKPLQG